MLIYTCNLPLLYIIDIQAHSVGWLSYIYSNYLFAWIVFTVSYTNTHRGVEDGGRYKPQSGRLYSLCQIEHKPNGVKWGCF